MFSFKRLLAAVMAVLMLALSFSVALADDEDRAEDSEVLRSGYASGTYQGHDFSLSSAYSTSSYLWSRGDYGTEINMKLRFKAKLCYYTADNSYQDWGTNHTKTYGPSYGLYISKSYTKQQWITMFELENVPAIYLFKECTYSLLIDNIVVVSFLDTYISY